MYTLLYILANFNFIGQQVLQFVWITERHFFPLQIIKPLYMEITSELPAEGPYVAEEGGAQQTVTQQTYSLLLQFL